MTSDDHTLTALAEGCSLGFPPRRLVRDACVLRLPVACRHGAVSTVTTRPMPRLALIRVMAAGSPALRQKTRWQLRTARARGAGDADGGHAAVEPRRARRCDRRPWSPNGSGTRPSSHRSNLLTGSFCGMLHRSRAQAQATANWIWVMMNVQSGMVSHMRCTGCRCFDKLSVSGADDNITGL